MCQPQRHSTSHLSRRPSGGDAHWAWGFDTPDGFEPVPESNPHPIRTSARFEPAPDSIMCLTRSSAQLLTIGRWLLWVTHTMSRCGSRAAVGRAAVGRAAVGRIAVVTATRVVTAAVGRAAVGRVAEGAPACRTGAAHATCVHTRGSAGCRNVNCKRTQLGPPVGPGLLCGHAGLCGCHVQSMSHQGVACCVRTCDASRTCYVTNSETAER